MSEILKLYVSNENQMMKIANILATALPDKGVLLIEGTMGSGKTFFCRHLIQAKQRNENIYIEDVPSPTFTLVQTYIFEHTEIWHCDFYRINTDDEFIELGIEEGFENALCLIEWPKNLKDLGLKNLAILEIKMGQKITERELVFVSESKKWEDFENKFKGIVF